MTGDIKNEFSSFPDNKAELLGRIERNWSALLGFLEEIDEARLLRSKPGHWSIKDNLAHLAFWERFLLLHHVRETPADLVLEIDRAELRQLNEDQLNQIIWERSQGCSLSEVIRGLHETHARVVAELETIEFEVMGKPDQIETLIERPLLESVVSNTYEHYQEHLKTMQRELED
jgi:hypothetical protein